MNDASHAVGYGAVDDRRWVYRGLYMPFARTLSRYHRTSVRGAPYAGPCVYVTHHGAGYLNLDLVVVSYHLGWQGWYERGAPRTPLFAVAAESAIEKALPGLPRVKRDFGMVGTSEAACLDVLERGGQLLITPGGRREAQPSARPYELRWSERYGFVRLALQTGVPIVPVATVGGREAYPGFKWKKLSFWSPVPLPARFDIAVGEPIRVERQPGQARNFALVKPLHAEAWRRTQSLYDRLLAERRA